MLIATRIEEHGNLRLRVTLVFLVTLVLFSVIGLRLFQKQVLQYGHYADLAYKQRYREEKIRSARGQIFVTDIYSNDYYPLVTNKTFWAVMIVPQQVTDAEGIANGVGPIIGMAPQEILDLLSQDLLYIPPLKHKLTDEQRKAIEQLDLSGVTMLPEFYRDYPEGSMGSRFLGFVDANGEGQYGIEGYLNQELKGESGKLIAERDILGRQITVVDNQVIPPQNGSDVVLTIDRVIQFMAERAIREAVAQHEADSGSVVIMDPRTGGILALAEYPTYDPANYTDVKAEEYDIFKTMAIAEPYESGSVFKAVTMAAGIDAGAVTPDTGEYFEANVQVDDYVIWNSERKAHGYETMTQVLENSDNVGMVWMVDQLGRDPFYDYVKAFGFGDPTGIEISGEEAGMIQDKEYAPDVGIATMSFGQGITVTEMQLLQAISTIANGGVMMQPHIVKEYIDKDGKTQKVEPKALRKVISRDTSFDLAGMLTSVVERGHGKQAQVKGYRIGGKTGTAQIPYKDRRGYEPDKFTGSFYGFGPVEDPAFAMIVRINVPKDVVFAESTAAPVFGRLAAEMLNYYQLPPDQEWAKEQEKIAEELRKEREKR